MTGERTRSERLLHETVGASVLSRHLGHRQLHTHIFAYANTCVNSPHLAAVLSRGGRCRCGTRRLLRPARRPTVILATDGLAITLAEHWVGAGKGVDNMMGMVISTGAGGGLILGGRPKHGASGNAGHIGHIEVSAMDGESTFGHPGTLEAVASGPPFGRVGATSRLGRDHRRRAFTRLRAWRRNSSRRHHPGGHRRWAGDLQRGRSAGSGAGRDRRRILPSHA